MSKAYNWKNRPLSWSAISSFEYDPEQWYTKYVLNIYPEPTKEMTFGSLVGKKIETNPKFLPMIPRHSIMEFPFKCKFGKIELVGFADTFCDKTFRKLGEFKTGKRAWDQKRVDEHGQIDMYLLMNFVMHKVKPEEVEVQLVWMPTMERSDFSIFFVPDVVEKIKIFKTKRTMVDILRFGERINKTVKAMTKYAENHA